MSYSLRFPRRLAAALAALALGVTAVGAQAQPRRDQSNDQRNELRNHDNRRPQARPQQGHGPQAHRPSRPPQVHSGRGAGPERNWYRGGRVPPAYRSHHYVVTDWRHHHLSQPPRGYHWVQYGSDYLLVAIATGVIAQLILSN